MEPSQRGLAQSPTKQQMLYTVNIKDLKQTDKRQRREFRAETHAKRQATQHDCLPSLLGDGDKLIEIVTVRKKTFVLDRLE